MTIETTDTPARPSGPSHARETQILTASRGKSFRACQRKHFFEYVLGVRAATDPLALRFGTVTHHALEAYWCARGPEHLRARLHEHLRDLAPADVILSAIPESASTLDPFEYRRMLAMLGAYATRWDAIACDVLAVEIQFEFPLLNPESGRASTAFTLGGKIDAVVRLEDGRIAVLEHKTSAENIGEGSEYRQRLTMDGQVSQYFEGGDVLHAQGALPGPVDLVIYDVLGKPRIGPLEATPVESRKYTKDGRLYAAQREFDETPDAFLTRCVEKIAESPDDYLVHAYVHRFDTERDEFREELWMFKDQLLASESLIRRGRKPPKNPDACFKYGKPCTFLAVCQGRASIDDPTLFRRATRQNEELAAA